jgi:outer membrane lipoprotein-sorting protein
VVKIACTPKPNAPVTWGKVVIWIQTQVFVPLKQEFYSEDGTLVKRMTGSNLKRFGTHTIPSTVVIEDVKKKDWKTRVDYSQVIFDQAIDDSYFKQDFLRR